MNLELPETKSDIIKVLWNVRVRDKLEALADARQEAAKFNPPTKAAVDHYISEAARTNPEIQQLLMEKRAVEARLDVVWGKLESHALSHMTVEGDKGAAKKKYNSLKRELIYILQSIMDQAEYEEEPQIFSFCEEILNTVVKTTPRPKSTITRDARKWLRANHPELNISNKGKIPEAALLLYNNRESDGEEEGQEA